MSDHPMPSVGRIVLVEFSSETYNGAKVHPAIVNRVWGDRCVNLTVFPDGSSPQPLTSVERKDVVEAREAPIVDGKSWHPRAVWFWPPRA